MKEITAGNFGLLVAYLLPGFVCVLGVAASSTSTQTWITPGGASGPSVGGFLYLTLASLTAGMLVSAVRWAIVDRLHHATGVRPPTWDFQRLQERLSAFELLVESHYRYYQFYANMLVAATAAYASWRTIGGLDSNYADVGFVALESILFLGSRDALSKYYRRAEQLLH